MASQDQSIVEALAVRLADIATANGYRTNAGLYVDPDEREAKEDEDTFPRLTWTDRAEEVVEQIFETDAPLADRTVTEIVFTVVGFDRVETGESPGDLARVLCADIKQAMIRADDKRLSGRLMDPLRYIGRVIERPDTGRRLVAVEARFSARYLEQAGDPDAQLTN